MLKSRPNAAPLDQRYSRSRLLAPRPMAPVGRSFITTPTMTIASTRQVTGRQVNVATGGVLSPSFWIGGGSYLLEASDIVSKVGASGQGTVEPIIIEFMTEDPVVEIVEYNNSGNVRYLIDDGAGWQTFRHSDGNSLFCNAATTARKFDWGGVTKMRRYRIEGNQYKFFGVDLSSAASTLMPTRGNTRINAVWLTDSYGYVGPATSYGLDVGGGAGPAAKTGSSIESLPWEASRILNWENPILKSVGGTSAANNGGNAGADFGSRFDTDVKALNLSYDVLVIASEYNSNTFTQPQISTALANLYSKAFAYNPVAPIVQIGPWVTQARPATDVTSLAIDATSQVAALAAGVAYVSPIQGKAYDQFGNVMLDLGGPWVTTASQGTIIKASDQIHLTAIGAQIEAGLMAQSIAAALKAPY